MTAARAHPGNPGHSLCLKVLKSITSAKSLLVVNITFAGSRNRTKKPLGPVFSLPQGCTAGTWQRMGWRELTGREVSRGLCGFHPELPPNAASLNDHGGQGVGVQCWRVLQTPQDGHAGLGLTAAFRNGPRGWRAFHVNKWWARKVRAWSEKGNGRALGGRQICSPAREMGSSRQRGQKKIQ